MMGLVAPADPDVVGRIVTLAFSDKVINLVQQEKDMRFFFGLDLEGLERLAIPVGRRRYCGRSDPTRLMWI